MTAQMYDDKVVERENRRMRTMELAREASAYVLKVIADMMTQVWPY
jgi:hypothetical protein